MHLGRQRVARTAATAPPARSPPRCSRPISPLCPPPLLPPQNTLTVNEVLQDDDNSPVGFVTSCDDLLRFSNPPYEDAYARCFSNTDAALDCPANSYPVMVVLDLNEDDQKVRRPPAPRRRRRRCRCLAGFATACAA